MSIRTKIAALAATLFVAVGGTSQAAFTYSTTENPSTFTFGGSTVNLTGVTSATSLSGTTIINAVNVALTSTTAPPATDTGSLTFTDTVHITPTSGGSVNLLVNQTLTFIRSDTGGEVSFDTLNAGASTLSGTAGGFTYTISAIQYAGPTVGGSGNNGPGTISYIIQETPVVTVPEPASVAMVVLGLGGVFAARRFRRRAI